MRGVFNNRLAARLFALFLVAMLAGGWVVKNQRVAADWDAYQDRVLEFRKQKDSYLRADSSSPMPNQALFSALSYYPLAPAWRFRLHLISLPDTTATWLPTTAGTRMAFKRLGWLQLPAPGGGVYPIMVYRQVGATQTVVLFKDAAAGTETPEIGRYVDVALLPSGYVDVDFNLAYAPYATYNPALACPLPPLQNHVPFGIPAGERLDLATAE